MGGPPPDHGRGGGDREGPAEGKAFAGAGEISFRADGRVGGRPRAPVKQDGQRKRGASGHRAAGPRRDLRLFRKRDLHEAGGGKKGFSAPKRLSAENDGIDGGAADGRGASRPDPFGHESSQLLYRQASAAGAGLRVPRRLPPPSWKKADTSRTPRGSFAGRRTGKRSPG